MSGKAVKVSQAFGESSEMVKLRQSLVSITRLSTAATYRRKVWVGMPGKAAGGNSGQ